MLFPVFRAHAVRAASVSLCAVALFGSQALFAAEAPKKGAAAAKTPLLTREELRSCMNTKTKLHQQRDETLQLQSQLDAEKTEIQRAGDELKQRLAALDRTNREQVEKFVESNNAHEKRIDAYTARGADFNAKVDSLTADNEAYKKACENRRFDEKDEIAIKNGK